MAFQMKRGRAALWLGSAATAAALGLFAPNLALAATETAVDQLPDLVVTAERRTENLQDVSLSATVMNAEQLEEAGVTRLSDLQQVSPSLAINTYNRSTFVNIRGVGLAQSAPTSSPGVAFYIDGALIPHEQTIGLSFYDINSVEVFRGPQGTLTGQNSTGGAIYLTTPAPDFSHLSGYGTLTAGNYSWYKLEAAVNIPLGDTFAIRISGVRDVRESFTSNIGPSASKPGNIDLTAARVSARWQPIETLRLDLRYEYFRSTTDYNPIKNRADAVSSDPFVIEEDAISFQNLKGTRVDFELNYEINSWARVRAQVGHQDFTSEDMSDGDRTATTASPTGRLGYALTSFDTWVSEIDVASNDPSAPLQWVFGGFYLDEDVPVLLYRYNNSRVIPDTAPTSTTRTIAHNTSKSVFGQLDYTSSPQWKFTLGLRYSRDQQRYDRIIPAAITGVARSQVVTGRAAINWTPVDNTMFYVSVARGYKAGGVNLSVGDPPILPETNTVEEVGFKITAFDGHVRLNGDVFASQYQNIQLGSIRNNAAPPPATLPIIQNVSDSKAWGVEVELMGVWGPLQVNAGIAWLHAVLDVPSLLSDNTGATTVLVTVPAGEALPFSPELTFNAGLQYRFEFAIGSVTPRVQWAYISTQYATPFHQTPAQQAVTTVPAHSVFDFRMTWAPTDEFRVEGFITNLTNETYIASQVQNSSTATGGIIYGAPRQVGVRVTYALR